LQNVKIDLERLLSTLRSKNTQLEEDLKREQQWHEEQEQVVEALNRTEEESKAKVAQLSKKSVFTELQNQTLKVKIYKEELLNALNEFLGEHFPIPESGGKAEMKNSSEEPATELIKLNDILEILTNKLMNTPHEPYVTISKSFWPPYIELLLRFGIALRHPEDPNRIRLQHFHI
ncbi:CENPK protein, partial [Podilymbus podiceps]|nr:CENPK protein [Podilymbus podiceps]